MDWLTSNCASLKLLQPQPLPGVWNGDGSGLLPCQKSRVPAAMDRCATQLDEVYGSNVWSAMAYVSAYRQMFGSCAEFGFPGDHLREAARSVLTLAAADQVEAVDQPTVHADQLILVTVVHVGAQVRLRHQRDHLTRGFLPGRRSLAAVPFGDTQVSQY